MVKQSRISESIDEIRELPTAWMHHIIIRCEAFAEYPCVMMRISRPNFCFIGQVLEVLNKNFVDGRIVALSDDGVTLHLDQMTEEERLSLGLPL